jgi:uncharacterized UPF0160 family protein
VEEVDAIDNGIDPVGEVIKPRYDYSTGICSRIGWKNPQPNNPNADYDRAFMEAMRYIGEEFESLVSSTVQFGLKELDQLRVAFANRHELDPSGQIIEISGYFNYNQHLKVVEGSDHMVLFVIYPREDRTWTVRSVGTGRGFEFRKDPPYKGWGRKELSEATGIPGAIFSHKSGLITVFDTKEHALEFAKLAIQ